MSSHCSKSEDSSRGGKKSNMRHIKARIFGLVLILAAAFIVHINWHQLRADGQYSVKMAAFGPVIGVGGLFLLILPSMAGRPTTAKEKIIVLLVLLVGMLAGLANWYLMDPHFFGR